MLLRQLTWVAAVVAAAAFAAPVAQARPAEAVARAATTGPPIKAPEQAPWSVYISLPDDGFCSGSVVDATHVLTAAHCTRTARDVPLAPRALGVYAGLSRSDDSPANTRLQQRSVSAVAVHPYYSEARSSDDVAVLTLDAPLALNAAVQPIALVPVDTPVPTSSKMLVVGWGATRRGEPDAFQHGVTVQRVERPQCATGYPGILCAGSPTDAVCPGDSGSGLVLNPMAGRVLVGADSFGASGNRCVMGTPDGFADLASREIGLWLRGVPRPPRGPRTTGAARIVAHPGRRVSCRAPRWTGAPSVRSAFFLLGRSTPAYVGTRRYRVPARAAGRRMICMSIATNANGTARARSRNYLRFR